MRRCSGDSPTSPHSIRLSLGRGWSFSKASRFPLNERWMSLIAQRRPGSSGGEAGAGGGEVLDTDCASAVAMRGSISAEWRMSEWLGRERRGSTFTLVNWSWGFQHPQPPTSSRTRGETRSSSSLARANEQRVRHLASRPTLQLGGRGGSACDNTVRNGMVEVQKHFDVEQLRHGRLTQP